MILFQSDYLEGCAPEILEALVSTNYIQTPGYGEDAISCRAKEKIKARIGKADADIHFLVGGTQANLTVLSAALRPHQSVITPDTGHINGHETGAVEATGHKCIILPSIDGRISAEAVAKTMEDHLSNPAREHVTQPGAVYISFPTESGTLYSKKELQEMKAVTERFGLVLFIDGARLGYGLAASDDVSIEDIASLSDVFYIGGTKCGALFGEAVAITNPALKKDFRYIMKQKGAMLAKGRLLGIQFDTLFTDDLYFRITAPAVRKAEAIRQAFRDKGIELWGKSNTNQVFAILGKEEAGILSENFAFEFWDRLGDRTIFRFTTSWATTDENVKALIEAINSL